MDTEKLNSEVRSWTKSSVTEMKSEANRLGIDHRTENTKEGGRSRSPAPAVDILRSTISKRLGVPYKISFKFPRHMVFVHKGVGRGTSASEAGTGSRTPKEWFSPIIEKNIENLGDIVAENLGESIINNLRF